MLQTRLFDTFTESTTIGRDVTFSDAKFQEVHRWYPYLEGFAVKFIEDILSGLDFRPQHIYEPFAGSGTLPVYCLSKGISISYSEVNPFLQELISFKIDVLKLNTNDRNAVRTSIKEQIGILKNIYIIEEDDSAKASYVDVFGDSKYFDENNFSQISRIRQHIKSMVDGELKQAIKIAACEALLPSSYLKRAGDIRYKKGKELNNISEFISRFIRNLEMIWSDLGKMINQADIETFSFNNAKTFESSLENSVDLVITSPPYLNGTNYIRNTKLELWFLGYLKSKKDLNYYRKEVVTSGINDVSSIDKFYDNQRVINLISDSRLLYDRRIPKMINDYFFDMDIVFANMSRYLKKNGHIFIDIGDSIYGGVHIPTDEILIEVLQRNSFQFVDNLKLRARKSKCGDWVKQSLIIAKR